MHCNRSRSIPRQADNSDSKPRSCGSQPANIRLTRVELRAEQVREVFALLDAAAAAVADGTIVPARVPVADELDPAMAALWDGFVADAADPEAAAEVERMLATGAPVATTAS